MIDSIWTTMQEYGNFYVHFLQQQWHNMTPMRYGILLISIGVFGFLLMKSGARR